ncbi:MAG: M24 family metallopeptidase [Planctomycetota bacterium]|nr:M24 family metallopeptidase [Planctomycetota bacterium]
MHAPCAARDPARAPLPELRAPPGPRHAFDIIFYHRPDSRWHRQTFFHLAAALLWTENRVNADPHGTTAAPARPTIIAGVPAINMALYHRIRFKAGDPGAILSVPREQGGPLAGESLIIRDVELERARRVVRADRFYAPRDLEPPPPVGPLSGDRPTATAQAAAELIVRAGLREIWTDRTLPMIFAWHIQQRGVSLHYDPDLGVRQRRSKDEQEVQWLRDAQRATEDAIQMACTLIARAAPDRQGLLIHDNAPLTPDRVRAAIDIFLMQRGYAGSDSIIAGGTDGGDCHNRGSAPLRTEQPIIVDVFPRSQETLYFGDCTRMVVHGPPGNIPDLVRSMHAAVVEAKAAAIAATHAGTTGEAVHRVVIDVMRRRGYPMGLPTPADPPTRIAMVHGTGHGLGLDMKEQPLLDLGGPTLVAGDAVTIEPGLYAPAVGGMRLEDLVIVRDKGCENLNTLHEGLTWT